MDFEPKCFDEVFRAKTWEELSSRDETEYLLSTEANRERLLESVGDLWVKDPTRLLKIQPYSKPLEWDDITKALEASIYPYPVDRTVKLYTGEGGMRLFQQAMQENIENFEEKFGDSDF